MKAYRKFVAFTAVLSAASVASAQAAEPQPSTPAPQAWTSYRGERHIVGRVLLGDGLRFNDAYGAGANLPLFLMADGHFLFVNAGNFHMGPSLGLHLGFDIGHSSMPQFGIVPGWTAMWRLNPRWGVSGRFGVPIVVTRGVTDPQEVPNSRTGGHSPILAPQNPTLATGLGFELGVGGVFYFLSGVGVTAEISGGIYLGDSYYVYPYLAGALGLIVDYELLP